VRGRPRLFNKQRRAAERKLAGKTWREIAAELGVHEQLLYWHMAEIKGIMSTLEKGVPA
jgi:hypothetical protein